MIPQGINPKRRITFAGPRARRTADTGIRYADDVAAPERITGWTLIIDTNPAERGKTMPETPMIRFVSYDRDPVTQARIVSDIRETAAPARIEGSRSYTALSKDERRRELMVAFALEVDRLLAGETDELNVFVASVDPVAVQ